MQTFLPHKSFKASAACLDTKRLGKQRLEAFGINYLVYYRQGIDKRKEYHMTDKYADWLIKRYVNHPAVIMWSGCQESLQQYFNCIVYEWAMRGYLNNYRLFIINDVIVDPVWLGDDKFHSAHRAALLFKNYPHYKKFEWDETPAINYIWPKNM